MSFYQLSPDQLDKFHKDGFLLVEAEKHKLVTGADLPRWANEIHSWPREQGKWMPYDEVNEKGESQLMRTECFVDYHTGLKALLCGDELSIVMRQLADHVSLDPTSLSSA
jgi:2-aminoethylphosphonate dioxygenase